MASTSADILRLDAAMGGRRTMLVVTSSSGAGGSPRGRRARHTIARILDKSAHTKGGQHRISSGLNIQLKDITAQIPNHTAMAVAALRRELEK